MVLLRALGAKLGAIRCGLLRTAMDGYGQRTVWLRTLWTATDSYGRPASIYGSEGWGFEFLRACQQGPVEKRLRRVTTDGPYDAWEPFSALRSQLRDYESSGAS